MRDEKERENDRENDEEIKTMKEQVLLSCRIAVDEARAYDSDDFEVGCDFWRDGLCGDRPCWIGQEV